MYAKGQCRLQDLRSVYVLGADASDAATPSQPYDDKPARGTSEYNFDAPDAAATQAIPSGKVSFHAPFEKALTSSVSAYFTA